ncbi:MAG: hypothetical protein Q8Q88_01060 [Phenylobacterium sp.]|uniref:hypothetical protein n=1 Tax=Phenylobacterium sp. TaxID=1871053 RepID=UPI002733D28D|nr:hypothetical protein [Phenylobacterium sp.]MDP3745614.1 hypothetical protein [Phenylobacterium sp.]
MSLFSVGFGMGDSIRSVVRSALRINEHIEKSGIHCSRSDQAAEHLADASRSLHTVVRILGVYTSHDVSHPNLGLLEDEETVPRYRNSPRALMAGLLPRNSNRNSERRHGCERSRESASPSGVR